MYFMYFMSNILSEETHLLEESREESQSLQQDPVSKDEEKETMIKSLRKYIPCLHGR